MRRSPLKPGGLLKRKSEIARSTAWNRQIAGLTPGRPTRKAQKRKHRTAPTAAEKTYMGMVAALGCAVCRRLGHGATSAEVHHMRTGAGGGRRASHWHTAPLCPEHHRGATGLHGLGTKGFGKNYGFEEVDLIRETQVLLLEHVPASELLP